MAEARAIPELIKSVDRWSSTAFKQYIRKNPVLLHTLILLRGLREFAMFHSHFLLTYAFGLDFSPGLFT
jgi:hypothetical protein